MSWSNTIKGNLDKANEADARAQEARAAGDQSQARSLESFANEARRMAASIERRSR